MAQGLKQPGLGERRIAVEQFVPLNPLIISRSFFDIIRGCYGDGIDESDAFRSWHKCVCWSKVSFSLAMGGQDGDGTGRFRQQRSTRNLAGKRKAP